MENKKDENEMEGNHLLPTTTIPISKHQLHNLPNRLRRIPLPSPDVQILRRLIRPLVVAKVEIDHRHIPTTPVAAAHLRESEGSIVRELSLLGEEACGIVCLGCRFDFDMR